MGYKVHLKDGSTVTLKEATKQVKDGSGLYLYDKDGLQVASFPDGTFGACYPMDALLEAPPVPVDPMAETTKKPTAKKKA